MQRHDLTDFPVPRYELAELKRYFLVSIQFSSGCPWYSLRRYTQCRPAFSRAQVPRKRSCSLHGHPARLDRARPFLDLAAHKVSKIFGCRVDRRPNLEAYTWNASGVRRVRPVVVGWSSRKLPPIGRNQAQLVCKLGQSIGVEAKGKVGGLSSTVGTGPIESPRPSNAVLERATGQLGTPARTGKEGMQADATVSRPATVSARTCANFATSPISTAATRA